MGKEKNQREQHFLEDFYPTYRVLLFRLAGKLTDNPADREDLVQETLSRLLDKISLLATLAPCQVEAYIARTMQHTYYNALKKRQLWKMLDIEDETLLTLADRQASREQEEEMQAHLEVLLLFRRLKPEDRLLLEGWYLLGKTPEALAEAVGCKPDTIRSKLHRARKRALQLLKGEKNHG